MPSMCWSSLSESLSVFESSPVAPLLVAPWPSLSDSDPSPTAPPVAPTHSSNPSNCQPRTDPLNEISAATLLRLLGHPASADVSGVSDCHPSPTDMFIVQLTGLPQPPLALVFGVRSPLLWLYHPRTLR
eukprot:TRINITY_DN3162_c0_g1_i3.p1 TRINITY_DN3162_c0_g1~~TRINITY_DN3162_c0_g1_i3.p1  ORF type:complete len:129 (-),score=6.49 TRINITY_DN3162_c0_g1_i3:85-471(-)